MYPIPQLSKRTKEASPHVKGKVFIYCCSSFEAAVLIMKRELLTLFYFSPFEYVHIHSVDKHKGKFGAHLTGGLVFGLTSEWLYTVLKSLSRGL